jgi:hypothetical protein
VLTVGEVATHIGWGYRRTLRLLERLNAELQGMLLRNVARAGARRPTYTVTLEAMRRAAPEWFADQDAIPARLDSQEEQLAAMRARVETLEVGLEQTATVAGEARRSIREMRRTKSAA